MKRRFKPSKKSATQVRFDRAARAIRKKRRDKYQMPAGVSEIYWPDHVDEIRAIAMTGMTDEEMARALGIKPELFESWKQFYPLFAEAIEKGRTNADAQVIAALHKNAVGFSYTTDEVVKTKRGADVVTVDKYVPPETNAQKFWLSNRSAAWRQNNNLQIGGQRDGKPADSISVETKMQVIHSILNMITPRPDGDGRPPRRVIENG